VPRTEFEDWLSLTPEDPAQEPARRRFHSLYLDMLEVCRAEFGHAVNQYALAAYAVWRNTPTALRVPASQIELAQLLGYTNDAVFRKWRSRYPALFSDERTRDTVRHMVMERIADVTNASLACAIDGGPQGFQDRKLMLEIAKLYKPSSETDINLTTKAYVTISPDDWDADETADLAPGA
jgi:hypothetical protein